MYGRRRLARTAGFLTSLLLLVAGARPGLAFEFLDGRLQIHGFYENQIRMLGRDLDPTDDLDLAQWYHVLNVEVEWDVAPDGWGPFDLISTFARLEGRYDCVWQRGCGLLRADEQVYGDDARHLPKRVSDARRPGFTGTVPTGDLRRRHVVPRELNLDIGLPGPGPDGVPGTSDDDTVRVPYLDFPFRNEPVPDRRRPAFWFNTPVLDDLFNNKGVDATFGTEDDPAPFYFQSVIEGCKYNFRHVKGPENGIGTQPGVWNPGCEIRTLGLIADKPNIFNPDDPSPITGLNGSTGGPFRPPPLFQVDGTARPEFVTAGILAPGQTASNTDARGMYYPNVALQRLEREFDNFDQNFRQAELEWNRGASQQDEKELKELYVDLEAFDSRLWIRAGKQSIVWGKTELFRTTDQFNPQDIALTTLADLEESRISLWSLRGVWSFYEVGPLEDVRLELALNFDQFEPTDLGRCGEPFAPNPVCTKTFGLLLHGVFAEGLAGEIRPPDPWNDLKGLEFGGRLEWRWGRFSFQLADFYGFDDFPYLDIAFPYERNVDPRSGRPRRAFARGECNSVDDPSCLGVVSSPTSPSGNWFTDRFTSVTRMEDGTLVGVGPPDGLPDRAPDPRSQPDFEPVTVPAAQTEDVVLNHQVNTQTFALICSTSIGFVPTLDPTVCGQSILNSQNFAAPFRIVQLLSGTLAGSPIAEIGVAGGLTGGVPPPLIPLNRDLPQDDPLGIDGGTLSAGIKPGDGQQGLGDVLTAEQEALLGCGPIYGTDCDDDGVDLMNAEASAIVQSWSGFEGTTGRWRLDFGDVDLDVDGDGIPDPQPLAGTQGFVGGSPCLRYENGTVFILPGCRGPDYDATTLSAQFGGSVPVVGTYDPSMDGCARPDVPGCAGASGGRDGTGFLRIPDVDVDGDGLSDFGSSVGQQFVSEMAVWSWNAMIGLGVGLSSPDDFNNNGTIEPQERLIDDFNPANPLGFDPGENGTVDDFADLGTPAFDDPLEPGPDGVLGTADDPRGPGPDQMLGTPDDVPLRVVDRCGFLSPQFCGVYQGLFLITGVQRASVRAGSNGRFGRVDFLWHGGVSAVLRYQKRNVLGFSMDFAEDRTKSNWSTEFAWIEGLQFRDHDEFDNLSEVDTYNLTISVDRPTFINFLNPNRTFFFNSQWFFQYVDGYKKGFQSNGPFNVLFTLTAETGYSDDRLQPRMTFVYDFNSSSGAYLPRITYRFTSNFSGTFGLNFFWGRFQSKRAALTQTVLAKRVDRGANNDFVENALSAVRDRDEIYFRIRYTF